MPIFSMRQMITGEKWKSLKDSRSRVSPLKSKDISLDSRTEEALEKRLESIADEKLKEALHRLGAGALTKRPGFSHEK